MQMDFETVKPAATTTAREIDNVKRENVKADIEDIAPVSRAETPVADGKKVQNDEEDDSSKGKKDPSKKTIDAAFSDMNARVKKQQQNTRCEYSYDEPTKRISIKVYDKDTEELIREVPPEESLEVLQKVWELAGIIVDEKR